jgi:hypothetical protein
VRLSAYDMRADETSIDLLPQPLLQIRRRRKAGQSFRRGRARCRMISPVPGFTTTLLLPVPLPIDWGGGMNRSTAEIVREYGPFSGIYHVRGVTYDGQHI